MLLKFSGIDVTPERLTESVYSQNKEGSLQPSIVAAIRRNQRIAYEIDDWSGLLAELNAGRPVLVLENLGVDFWPFWHYSLVIGYDSERDEVILHSGTHADERVNARRFAFRWLRGQLWGLVALKPDEWPANAEENKYLQAVLGFARVNPDAALTSFELATQHWPSNAKAWVGLGNTALEQKSFLKAVMALEKASTLAPQSSGIWNNLTLAYFYAGQQKEAEQAIRMAKKLAPNDSAILETEKQILLKH